MQARKEFTVNTHHQPKQRPFSSNLRYLSIAGCEIILPKQQDDSGRWFRDTKCQFIYEVEQSCNQHLAENLL